MTTSTKCRAKNPSACTDPNCPSRKGSAASQVAKTEAKALLRRNKQKDFGSISTEGYWHLERMTVNLRELAQPVVSAEAKQEARKIVRVEDSAKIDLGAVTNNVYEYAEQLSKSIRAILAAEK